MAAGHRDPPWSERGGSGARLLVLIHGLAGTAEVWRPLVAALGDAWRGEWLALDLPGHGRSPRRGSYSIGGYAADVAALIGPRRDVVVVGHSMGGAVGLALASGWFGVDVRATVAAGIKVRWSAEELDRAAALAARSSRRFAARDAAAAHWLRLAGLDRLWDTGHQGVGPAVSDRDGAFEVAFDNRVNAIGAPPVPALLAAAQGHVVMARGANDPMVTDDQVRALGLEPRTVPGAGHNVHVERPAQFAGLILGALDEAAAR